ncbi:MAG TPA: caspase family protein [Gemmata sp.]|nr:caspase family protein [Gemmata sp.]
MPVIKTRCPECDLKVRVDASGDGEHEVECPECGHEFTVGGGPDAEPPPRRRGKENGRRRDGGRPRKPKAAAGNNRLVAGVAVGAVVLAAVVGGLVYALGGSGKQPVAKADAPAQPETPRQPDPPTRPTPDAQPNPDRGQPVRPGPNPGTPDEAPPDDRPALPPQGATQLPKPAEDAFTRAATFKPEGPLPAPPPLPPVERRPLLTLDPGGHTAFIRGVFFTPDAGRVLSVSEDKSVRVWDVQSGECLATVRLPAGPDVEGKPLAAALSPDGKRLAVGGLPLGGGKSGIPFYVLSAETGELVATVPGARNAIHSLDFSPDGRQIAVGSAVGSVQVYDFPSKKWVYQAPFAHKDAVKEVRFNPKRPLTIATVGRDHEVKIWALNRPEPLAQIRLAEQKPNAADWTSDGNTLAVGGVSGEVFLYDAAGKLRKTVPPALENGKDPIQVARMRFLPGDKQLVFGGVAGAGWAGVIDVEAGRHPVVVKDHTNTVMAVNRSADGALAVTAGGESNEIIVWDAKTGAAVRKFQSAGKGLWAVGWGKDGKSLAWGTTNRSGPDGLHALEQTLRLDEFLPGPPPRPGDYQRHVRADGGYSVRVDDFFQFTVLEDGKPLYQHRSRSDRIYSVTILPGKGIVVGASFAVYLLDTKTGKLVREFRGDRGLTTALAPSPDGRHFVSGSSDQVLRVWSPDREEPVLSVFAAGREWIAWTPQGYYACSPYGERLIAWQVNNGIDRLPAVHPAVRFRASLYQPALVGYLVPAGDLRLAMAMAARFERQQVAATALADVLPPDVTLSAPVAADDKPVVVRATAQGNARNPVVAMRLLVDGRPYQGAAGVKRFDRQLKAEATWEVALDPGSHTLAVLAESPVSKGMSQPVTVTRGGAESRPNLYVLAVGVSAYPGSLKLNYAASDATLLTRTLDQKSRSVFASVEMRVLTDRDGTKQGLREGLDWLKSKMTPKDVGVFFFSGHGGRDDDTGKFYLIPVDVGRDLDRTCLSGEELKGRLEDMPGRLVAILDACHSGSVTEIRPARADNLVRDLMTDDYGVVVLASSLGRECSLESPLTKAGFYTLGLTEGMVGRADFNRDGVVYLNELEYYAARRVQQLSGGEQNPTMGRPPTIRPFAISRP